MAQDAKFVLACELMSSAMDGQNMRCLSAKIPALVALSIFLGPLSVAAQPSNSPAGAQVGAAGGSGATAATSAPNNVAKPIPKPVSGPVATQGSASAPAGAVTTSDILALSRIVLDTSREHSQASAERLQMLMYFFGALGALVAFFGWREWKSVVRPFKDKLEALEKSHSEQIAHQKEEFERLLADQRGELDVRREAVIADFAERLHRNAVALVAAPLMWDDMEKAERAEQSGDDQEKASFLKQVIHRADRVIDGHPEKLDGYLAAILLVRKAYALKRLGDAQGAFDATVMAIERAGAGAHHTWLFNAACYAALSGMVPECCEYLAKAIQGRADMREDAKTEQDFDQVRDTEEFIALMQKAT